ncbi:MAG: hypothetical protein ABS882_09040, partial [Lysinibacillus sp.]
VLFGVEDIISQNVNLIVDTKIINLATRCILFTIQILLIINYARLEYIIQDPRVKYDFDIPADYENEIPLIAILKSIHLDYIITNENLKLDI